MYCVFMDHIVLCFALICVCYFPGERIDYEKVWRTISLFLHDYNLSSCQALTVCPPLAGRWWHCKMVVATEKLEDLLREASLEQRQERLVCSQWVKGNLVAAAILVLRGARQFLGLVLDESTHLMIRVQMETSPCFLTLSPNHAWQPFLFCKTGNSG